MLINKMKTKMKIENLPFNTTNWDQIEPVKHLGERGYALWRTQQFNDIRVRIVEYSEDYLALAL